jgi:hypothetical protein
VRRSSGSVAPDARSVLDGPDTSDSKATVVSQREERLHTGRWTRRGTMLVDTSQSLTASAA